MREGIPLRKILVGRVSLDLYPFIRFREVEIRIIVPSLPLEAVRETSFRASPPSGV